MDFIVLQTVGAQEIQMEILLLNRHDCYDRGEEEALALAFNLFNFDW